MPLMPLAPLGARAGRSLLTPKEEDSLLGEAAGAGMSLLGVIGNVLDTPNAFVRNVLAGRNPLPGILDPDERISGRDLLQQYGLVGENYEGLDAGDVAGFLAEIGTDPLTLVGGGTTKAGSIAKALGVFPKRSVFDLGTGALSVGKRTARRGSLGAALEGASEKTMKQAALLAEKHGGKLENFLAEPMQRSIGIGLPFRENAMTFDLPGATGRAAALDWLGGKARMSWPGRELTRLFDRTVRNVTGGKAQEFARNFTEGSEAAMADAEANHLILNDELLEKKVLDPDVRRNIIEGYHESTGRGRQLSPDEAVRLNLPQLDGEDLTAYESRISPIIAGVKSKLSDGESLRLRRVELGLTNEFQRHEPHYSFRTATRAAPGALEESVARYDLPRGSEMGRLATTPINRALADPEFIALAKAVDIDPHSAEALSLKPHPQIVQYLENMGYEDLEDVVDWQAKGMLSADPQRAAQNYNAVEQTAIGMGEAPELSRTVVPPKPDVDVQALQLARAKAFDYIGVPREHLDQLPQWLDDAKSLPALRKELEEVRETALASDYDPDLFAQELTYKGKVAEAEDALQQYRTSKARLDSREIFSRGSDEWFDIDRLNQEELTALENVQRRAGRGNYSRQQEYAEAVAQSQKLREQAARESHTLPKGEMSVQDVGRTFTVGKAVRAFDKQESKIVALNTEATNLERRAQSLKQIIDDAEAAKAELGAMESDYRQRGYFVKDESSFLKDQELRDIAALRNNADSVGAWRRKLERVQERIANGERQIFPAELIDDLERQIGIAEDAQARVAAMKLALGEADDLIKHGKKYGEGRLFNNDVIVDEIGKTMHDRRQVAWAEHDQDVIIRNSRRRSELPEGTQVVPSVQALRMTGGAGRDATSMNQAVRSMVRHGGEIGVIPQDIADNIASGRAVASSAVRNDKVAAQAMRQQELLDLRERLYTMKQGQVREIEASKTLSSAEKAAAFAGIERRFNEEAIAKIRALAESPLPDVSPVGNIMRVKERIAKDAKEAADESLAMGLLDNEQHAAEVTRIDQWLRSDKASLGPEVDEMMARVRVENPIPRDGLAALDDWVVPKELVDQVVAAKSLWEKPTPDGTFGKFIDKIRGLFKAHVTLPFPGFHGRNIQGSVALYLTLRAFDPDATGIAKFTKPLGDMLGVLRGQGLKDAEKIPEAMALGLKGKDAERWLLSQLSAKGSLRGAGDTLTEGIEPTFVGDLRRSVKGGESAEQLASNMPGHQPIDAEYFKAPFRKREGFNRANVKDPKQFVLTAAGARVSNFTENLFRGAAMIGLMRQGKTADEAAALMKAAFVDYSNLSKFERNFARRVIPFYSWLKHASAFALRDLVEHPAGFNAQLARLARVSQQDAGFLPPQLGGSLSIPLGQEEGGQQRYLSQMDFPVETLNRIVAPGRGGLLSGGTAENTLRNVVAQMDPIPKSLLETAFGKSSFRGRNLEDLDSPTQRIMAGITGESPDRTQSNTLDRIISATPASRYVGTLAGAFDQRKSIPDYLTNVTTGLRIADIDMDKARGIAAGQAAKDLLKDLGARQSIDVSFSKDELAKLDPATRAEAERLQAVLKALSRRAREAKKEKAK